MKIGTCFRTQKYELNSMGIFLKTSPLIFNNYKILTEK